MSTEENTNVGDVNSTSVGDQDQTTADGVEQKVSYETYKKTVDEVKASKARAKAAEEKLAKINEEKLKAEGKIQELLQQKEEELAAARELLRKKDAEVVVNRVHSKIVEVATKFGAYDANDVIKNIPIKDLGIDEEGNFDEKVLASKVDEVRKQKAYLFKATTSRVADANPTTKPAGVTSGTLLNLDMKQLEELYRNKR